jgi:hypothetical protein
MEGITKRVTFTDDPVSLLDLFGVIGCSEVEIRCACCGEFIQKLPQMSFLDGAKIQGTPGRVVDVTIR